MDKVKEELVQIQNPKSKNWTIVDRSIGKILRHSSQPETGIEKVYNHHSNWRNNGKNT